MSKGEKWHDEVVEAFRELGARVSLTLADGRTRIHGPCDSSAQDRSPRTHFCNVEGNGNVSIAREHPEHSKHLKAVPLGKKNTGRFESKFDQRAILNEWGSAKGFAEDIVRSLKEKGAWESLGVRPLGQSSALRSKRVSGEKRGGQPMANKMQLKSKEWDLLNRFIGYGAKDAATWLIGIEEGGTLTPEQLRVRCEFGEFADLDEASTERKCRQFFGHNACLQRTWATLAKTLLCVSKQHYGKENARRYQAEHLGRKSGTTCLAELLPLPVRKNKAWPYDSGPGTRFLVSRTDYQKYAIPDRSEELYSRLKESKPSFVWCHGKPYWDDFDRIFEIKEWDTHWLAGKADRKNLDEVRFADLPWRGLVIMTFHSAAAGMNAWTRIEKLAKFIRDRLDERGLSKSLTFGPQKTPSTARILDTPVLPKQDNP